MSTVQSAINKDCVKIGKGCYIAPGVQIISEVGDIVIGDFTIIEEGCFIRNNQMKRMMIGSYNVFEVGCRIENTNIGDCNVFEMRCTIESGSTIESNCRFGINAKVPPKQLFTNFSRVYYPFNVLKTPPYDPGQHKEEIAELCQSLFMISQKKVSSKFLVMEINKKYLFPERKKILQQLGPNPTEEQLQTSAKMYGIQLETLQKWVKQYEKVNSSDEETITRLLNEQRQLTKELAQILDQIAELRQMILQQ